MENNIDDILLYFIYSVFAAGIIIFTAQNPENIFPTVFIFAVFLSIFTLRHVFLIEKWSIILFCALSEITMVFVMGIIDTKTSYEIFYFGLIVDFIVLVKKSVSVPLAALSFMCCLLNIFFKFRGLEASYQVNQILITSLILIGIIIFSYILKFIIKQNFMLNDATSELKLKNFELQDAYERLVKADISLQDMALEKERNRIARDVHDIVGHNLTTAIVEIEAGDILCKNGDKSSFEKYDLAKEQIKKCLQDIRYSVRMLEDGNMGRSLRDILIELLNETSLHTGVRISYEIDDIDVSKKIKKIIYRAVQEGITNGIRHGKSTVFVLTLKENKNEIELILENNGESCTALVPGFGIRSMQERLKEVSGSLKIRSQKDEGVTLIINIRRNQID